MKKLATIFGLLMMMVLVTSFSSNNDIGAGKSIKGEYQSNDNFLIDTYHIGGGKSIKGEYTYFNPNQTLGIGAGKSIKGE